MKLFKFLASLVFLFTCSSLVAQKNAIKIGGGGLFYGKYSLKYERVVADNKSFQMSFGLLPSRSLPSDINEDFDDLNLDNKLSGYSLSPEFRFYTGKKGAPRGFYIAPYFRMSEYKFEFGSTFDDVKTKVDGSYFTVGAGAQLGVHWIISKRISLDWYFIGLGADHNTLKVDFYAQESGIDFEEFEDDINKELSDLPFIGDKVETEGGEDYVKVKTPFWAPGIRTGFSIGIVF